MWEEIFGLAIKSGLWAVSFLGLLIFVLKDSSKREQKYQHTIRELTSHLGIVKDIKDDVDQIKNVVFNVEQRDVTGDKTNEQPKE
jgi:hypothetical protein